MLSMSNEGVEMVDLLLRERGVKMGVTGYGSLGEPGRESDTPCFLRITGGREGYTVIKSQIFRDSQVIHK